MLSLDNELWEFDKNDFKEAITLLLLQDKQEADEDDFELKKLIEMQFQNDSDMKTWAMHFFDTVSFRNVYLKLKCNLKYCLGGHECSRLFYL